MYAVDGQGHTKSNVTKIGGGAAVGALLGGIFGGGKGAAIGALAGGGAGTAGAAATGKKEAKIGAETTMTFKVQ
jgi:outer membrane lipoprotein SlyB